MYLDSERVTNNHFFNVQTRQLKSSIKEGNSLEKGIELDDIKVFQQYSSTEEFPNIDDNLDSFSLPEVRQKLETCFPGVTVVNDEESALRVLEILDKYAER